MARLARRVAPARVVIRRRLGKPRRGRLVLAGLALLACAAWVAGGAPRAGLRMPASRPAPDYPSALARVAAYSADDARSAKPMCRSILRTHGARTGRAVVLLHGFTNCPRQFDRLGSLLHASGANVFIPRLPRHGAPDRMSDTLAGLTGDELLEASARAVDVARGLGDTVIVAGLSSSAVAAAALAQAFPGIDRAVLIAPSFGPRGVSPELTERITTLLLIAPNQFVWWDSKTRERVPGPTSAYPRFPTHALAQVYRLADALRVEARRAGPVARRIAIVTSESDRAVDNGAIRSLARGWRDHGVSVREVVFPESLAIVHDMIDPEQVGARVDAVYPTLIELILGPQ